MFSIISLETSSGSLLPTLFVIKSIIIFLFYSKPIPDLFQTVHFLKFPIYPALSEKFTIQTAVSAIPFFHSSLSLQPKPKSLHCSCSSLIKSIIE